MLFSFGLSKTAAAVLIFCCFAALSGCGSGLASLATTTATTTALPNGMPSIWVGAWGTSPINANGGNGNTGGSEQSFRFLIRPTVSGTEERVRFSNFFGTTPVTIGASRLAIGKDESAAIDTTHDVPLMFGGAASVTIQPGQIVVSDPVQLTYSFGQTLAVSVYLSGSFPSLTQHDSFLPNNFATNAGAGNATGDAAGSSFQNVITEWYLLNGVDVYGAYQGTVVLFGSSTTEGFKSNYGNTNTYPVQNVPVAGQLSSRPSDLLANRLNAAGYHLGVINAGINGATMTETPGSLVPGAVARLGRDVLQQPNVVAMVMYYGAIDLRDSDCKSAPEIEASAQQAIAISAAAKVRVLLATLPPSAFCLNHAAANFGPSPAASGPYAGGSVPGPVNPAETQRLALNDWIRTAGAALPGVVAVVDYDKVISDPAHPDFMLPAYNSGDNFHPNGAGYAADVAAIPLNLLLPAAQ